MPLVSTPAIVLSALRYSETSKIVRLATRDVGVQSAIAKGALRPRSRFGAALQLLSEGHAQLLTKEHRELHILAAFDLTRLHAGLAADIAKYAAASVLAELMLRFAPPDPHPESFDLLQEALGALEACVLDGAVLAPEGGLLFSASDGGAVCPHCAKHHGATHLPVESRADLTSLLDPGAPLPALDGRHAAAHRRLLARYIRYHLAEGVELPALDFWLRRPWEAA